MRAFHLQSVLACSLLVSLASSGEESGPPEWNEAGNRDSATSAQDMTPDGLSAADWSSIREAYESGRHAVSAVEGGYSARNPGQRWTTCFDGRGFSIRPDGRGWEWGLDLVRWGFEGQERDVGGQACAIAEGQRLTREWDVSLLEWYENDTRGLEHGYTVQERPQGKGPLTFTLAVRGGLRAQVQGDGRGVIFVNHEAAAVLTYTGLAAFDAGGQKLPARFELGAEGMRLCVDEEGARYPLRVDPIAQQAYLKASNTDAHPGGDLFGVSVAIAGDTVVVGALNEDSNATGVNGNQSDNSAILSGAAYVFVRAGTTWSQQAYLKATNTGAGDHFGNSVAISGSTVVVGAIEEDSNATGVNGNGSDNSATHSGAAYVFVRSGTTWSPQAYLKASNTEADDEFGLSVAISGDTVVVGAQLESSNATGVNGNQSDNSAPQSGAAYVFVRSGTNWSQQAYLKASNTGYNDVFGHSVAIAGDTLVVGAPWEDSNATGVNGNQSDDSASRAGATYVFVRAGTTWSQQAYLKASNTDADDHFGASSGISGSTVVVGAWGEDSNATGVDGNQSDNSAGSAGAAYVFVRSGTSWNQQAYVKASNTDAGDTCGESVAISGDTIVIGGRGENSNATGVDGNQSDNSAGSAGAAYVFVRTGTIWSQRAYLKASNTDPSDFFGCSAAISGDTVVVGAFGEDSIATGVNGDENDNSTNNSGAAYIFTLSTLLIPFCSSGYDLPAGSCPCSNEPAGGGLGCNNFGACSCDPKSGTLEASGFSQIGLSDTLVLTVTGMNNTSLTVFFGGTAQVPAAISGAGLRCVGGQLKRLYNGNGVGGAISRPGVGDPSVSDRSAALNSPISPGQTRYYYNVYRDPMAAAPCGFPASTVNTTNAVAVVWV